MKLWIKFNSHFSTNYITDIVVDENLFLVSMTYLYNFFTAKLKLIDMVLGGITVNKLCHCLYYVVACDSSFK